jgi:HSP20 family protein
MAAEQKLAKPEPAQVVRREDQEQYFQPATDILEVADGVTLKFDMPGVAKENVDITVDKDMLTVVGRAEPEQGASAVYRETHVGDYQRQFTLSPDLDPNNITATMNDGVLVVAIGKAEQAKPRKVKIAAAG